MKWQASRGCFLGPNRSDTSRLIGNGGGGQICERIVVFNKRDLVPEWGFEPFCRAMESRFPNQQSFVSSWNKPKDIKNLSDLLVSIAKRNPYALEMNVLVIGMPNVGKSTLLNALRNIGISGRTSKALRTSGNPGHTQAVSTRLKLCEDPLIYSYDSPGVMLPFLGRGERGAERGVKLALIAGIKEGLYDFEALASYLLYRLNILNPISPAYLQLLPRGHQPTNDLNYFLDLVADRYGMVKRGGERDLHRAAMHFIRWWRQEGGVASASVPRRLLIAAPGATPEVQARSWGFDFQWLLEGGELGTGDDSRLIQRKMEECIDKYTEETNDEEMDGGGTSVTQEKKQVRQEKIRKRMEKTKARLARRRAG